MTVKAIEHARSSRRAARSAARIDVLAPASLLVALGVSIALLLPRLEDWGLAMDEGAVLAYADLVREGAVPHRDFITFYGPGNLWLVAGFFELFGASVEAERAVGLLYRLVIVLALFAIGRRVAGNTAGVLAAVIAAAFMAQDLVWADATHGAIAFALLGVALAPWGVTARPGRRRNLILIAAGAAAGAAMLMRFDFAPAVIASAVPVLLAVGWRSRLWYVGGCLALACLYLPHLLLVGYTKLERLAGDIVASAEGRRLPIPSVWDHPGQLLLAAGVATGVVLVAGVVLVWRERAPAVAGRMLIGVALFLAGLIPWALSRPDELHAGPLAMISVSLLPAVGLCLIEALGPTVRGLGAIAAVATVAVLVADKADWESPSLPTAENGSRSFASQPDHSAAVNAVVQRLEHESREGESLFVGPRDLRRTNYGPTYVYYLLPKLEPASYYMELNPGTASGEGSGLADELRAGDWLVLTSDWDDWKEPNESMRFGSEEPNQVVRELFCRRLRAGTWELYERCDRDPR